MNSALYMNSSLLLFLSQQAIMQLAHLGVEEIADERAAFVEPARDGLLQFGFSRLFRFPVLVMNLQVVDVVKTLQRRAHRPDTVRVEASFVLLQRHKENTFFEERSVQCQDAHEKKVGEYAGD